ncbi:MAG: hypothetical protein M1834_004745 [Cirrosporium novae-zelandiae]|nr:MAG: hypothetical protein M1834_004745 [Cirrosporium novae-zelandiae]
MSSTIVLITGANSGVGFAAAKVIACASESFHVIMASRTLEKAKNAISEIEAAGIKGHLSPVQLDVTDENSVEQAAALVEQKFGRLDVLVNNAAVGNRDPNVKTRFQLSMDTNVVGPAVVSAAFRPLLLKSPKPYSIYVSSGVGSLSRASDPTSSQYRSLANGEAYRASKAALNMIALQESIVYDSTPLKVFAMCPGFVRSNLRGHDEESRSGWGHAGDPKISGETLLSIIQGKRDADAGKFVHKDGVYPW